MTCRKAEHLMARMRCNALTEGQRMALDRHVETCSGCGALQEAIRAGTGLLPAIDALPSPSGFARNALQQVAAEREPKRPGKLRECRRNLGRPWALAGLAAAAILTAVLLSHPHAPTGGRLAGTVSASRRSEAPTEPNPPFGSGTGKGASDRTGSARPRKGQAQPGASGSPVHVVAGLSPAPGAGTPARAPLAETRPENDLRYLDGFDPGVVARWSGSETTNLAIRRMFEQQLSHIEIKDDFVAVPYPRLAAAPGKAGARDAVRQYEREAKVVDARLFRRVTLHLKQTPLSDLCTALRQQTGVTFSASRSVADENVTLLVRELPARDVLRAVARLFGYQWARSGEEPAYRYELRQDLRAQIAEEELRSRQLHEALLALDEQLSAYRPLLELSPEEIRQRMGKAEGGEKYRLAAMSRWDWGPLQLYHRLTLAQRRALAAGETLEFRTDARSPALRLPGEWRDFLLQRTGFVVGSIGGQQLIAAPQHFDTPQGPGATSAIVGRTGAEVGIRLTIEGLQEGRPRLEAFLRAYLLNEEGAEAALSGAKGGVLGSAESTSLARANNAELNAKLRDTEPFRRQVTLRPRVTCPGFSPENRRKDWHGLRTRLEGGRETLYLDVDGSIRTGEEPPHVTSAEVWEAVHEATGMPVVADAYSRLYDAEELQVKNLSRFDALCRLGDRMRVRWQPDGGFLMGRSLTYLWDKVAEVPARVLRKWRDARDQHGYLPLEALLEASTLSDGQLDSLPMGLTIGHCWGLEDWCVIGEGGALPIGITGYRRSRPCARFAALLSDGQRARAQQQGLRFEELLPAQQEALLQLLAKEGRPARDAIGVRFRVDFAPAGTFVWNPSAATQAEADRLESAPFVWGKTAAETLAAARRAYPQAQAKHVVRSHGILTLTFDNPTTGARWKAGWIGVQIDRE